MPPRQHEVRQAGSCRADLYPLLPGCCNPNMFSVQRLPTMQGQPVL